jgi:enamine deaminase RidA (YjgF/YER057c/UK114 family)
MGKAPPQENLRARMPKDQDSQRESGFERASSPSAVPNGDNAGMGTRQWVSSGSPFEEPVGYSRATRAGDRIMVSGTAPVWPDGTCPDDARLQARRCFEIIEAALSQLGSQLSDIVRTRIYITSVADADAIGSVHGDLLRGTRPATSMVVVAGLLDPRWKVEIEADAVVGS